ncbi:P-loop containing nucleoside triphosphate hydrolase domain-containing protein [Rozella allomycis CSF55]|uniref:Origin recognition complex subunit 1 n=1 Tax=Rozella allomycis (strain CSF55) TaxID=988480 RepID=A0A075ATZ0_ROZAC|nr:P-loop containing nucleoside triphosphate hydrolase domain-containing protein [Rozella allomycis CSF55]|eukprot:EPZ33590.1 P-loop containing nucleoside triphosphate hydrolase domain-containing protein [Rozella allomycis CSF55]
MVSNRRITRSSAPESGFKWIEADKNRQSFSYDERQFSTGQAISFTYEETNMFGVINICKQDTNKKPILLVNPLVENADLDQQCRLKKPRIGERFLRIDQTIQIKIENLAGHINLTPTCMKRKRADTVFVEFDYDGKKKTLTKTLLFKEDSEEEEEVKSEDEYLTASSIESEDEQVEDESSSEEEMQVVLKTPTKKRKITQNTQKNRKKLMKMPILNESEVERKEAGTNFEKAREALHVSKVPRSLPCRENEYTDLFSSIYNSIEENQGCCIYIGGVPGQGKTAVVKEVIRQLEELSNSGQLRSFKFSEINGMKLTEPSQAYSKLWEMIGEETISSSQALDKLEKHFKKPNKKDCCVVLLDELDILVTQKQTVIYNFFDWPNCPKSSLIVIAIANTIDLPERMLKNRISSRMGMKRVNFQPYSHFQLMEIIKSRLGETNILSDDAIQLCARKVSAVSGDARRALDISRRAVEVAEQNGIAQVDILLMDKIIKEMYSSFAVQTIQHASFHQKMFLVSILSKSKSLGIQEIPLNQIITHYATVCRMHSIDPPHFSDLSIIASSLQHMNFITAETGNIEVSHKMRLNIQESELKFALKDEDFFKKILN